VIAMSDGATLIRPTINCGIPLDTFDTIFPETILPCLLPLASFRSDPFPPTSQEKILPQWIANPGFEFPFPELLGQLVFG